MEKVTLPAMPIGAPPVKNEYFRKVVVAIEEKELFEYRDRGIQPEIIEGALKLALDVRTYNNGVTVAETYTVVKVVEDSLGTFFDKVIVTRPKQDPLFFVKIHGTNWFQIIDEQTELALTEEGALSLQRLANEYEAAVKEWDDQRRLN